MALKSQIPVTLPNLLTLRQRFKKQNHDRRSPLYPNFHPPIKPLPSLNSKIRVMVILEYTEPSGPYPKIIQLTINNKQYFWFASLLDQALTGSIRLTNQ